MRSSMRDVRGGGRVIRGRVSSAGAIVAGTGFTVIRNGVGLYTVTFLTPFPSSPSVTATSEAGGSLVASTGGASTSAFQISLTSGGAPTDAAFAFNATEQER